MEPTVPLAFDAHVLVISLEKILPLRAINFDPKQHRIFQRILTSIREVGLVEPLMVFPIKGSAGQFTLLDGHLRLHALRDLGATEAKCLVSTTDEAYTYNQKVNRIAPIQEHLMIMKALRSGVSEERIAQALAVDVAAIRRKRDLLVGICPEAVDLLKEKSASPGALREMRKVKPLRQIEMAELMIAAGTYSEAYAQCLLAATPQDQLVESERPKKVRGLNGEDMARMEKEMQKLGEDFRMIEETHGRNVLDLVLACAYLRKLLDSTAVARYLSQHHADILAEFRKIMQSGSLDGSN